LLLLSCVIPLSSVAVKRSLLGHNPFDPNPAILGSDDYQLWLTLHQTTEMHFIPEALLSYRLHEGQMSGSYVTQLQRAERVLSNNQQELERLYGRAAYRLAVALIQIRKNFVDGHPVRAGVALLALPFRLANRERRSLFQYLRYGVLLRARTLFVRRMRPSTRAQP
jgi:hypothetical protein